MVTIEYPKPVMRFSELRAMGFCKEFLKNAYADPKQDFAWKINATKKNSPIMFETVGFEEYRQKQIALQQKARQHRVAIM